jgi:hypothetical protein
MMLNRRIPPDGIIRWTIKTYSTEIYIGPHVYIVHAPSMIKINAISIILTKRERAVNGSGMNVSQTTVIGISRINVT